MTIPSAVYSIGLTEKNNLVLIVNKSTPTSTIAKNSTRNYNPWWLVLIGACLFIPFLGGVRLFDWDEINFAEISREMLELGDYLRVHVNFKPFWEKPPFYFWLQASAMKVFGVGAFAARLPNAICGLVTLFLLFKMGERLYDRRFGFLWGTVYLGTTLPHLYFRSGIIDPFLNLFIFLGLYLFILFHWKKDGVEHITLSRKKWVYLFWAGFFIGMGILTKGQVAYMIVCLCFFVYWIYQRFRMYVTIPEFIFFSVAASLVTLSWYGLETLQNGPWFIVEFNKYQFRLFSTHDAGHKGFFGYHFVVLLVGCFPASVFALRSFFKMPKADYSYQDNFSLWMKILFWVVLILFSIVQSKIVHYSSMCYFPLSFLATKVISDILSERISLATWMKVALLLLGGLFILAVFAAPSIGQNPALLYSILKKPFARGNLEAEVTWSAFSFLPGILLLMSLALFFYYQKKKQREKSMYFLFYGNALFIFLTLIFFVKNIEQYSQAAAMDFYISKSDQDVYVEPLFYKSYGQLFYGKRKDLSHLPQYGKEWLLTGPIDKDAFFIIKIHRVPQMAPYPEVKEIGRKNGFVFYKREAQIK